VQIEVPSLNERREDILPITRYFLDKFSRKFRKEFTGLAPDAAQTLEQHNWTGNVRELSNLVERAVLLGNGTLLTLDLLGLDDVTPPTLPPVSQDRHPLLTALTADGIDIESIIHTIEKSYFEQALTLSKGNTSKAAKLLNLSRDKFRYRHKRLSSSASK
jgi:DNA-binding NtrC family response regulator